MQSIFFFQVCVFLGGQLKASQSNWQFFLGETTKQDDIKASFSYEESRRSSNTHFFLTKVTQVKALFLMASYKSDYTEQFTLTNSFLKQVK